MREALRQIWALARRDLHIELSYPIQPLVRFISLITITTSLFFVNKLVDDPPALARYGGHYFEFVMLGFVFAWFASNGLGAFGKSIGDDLRNGTLESLLVSPTSIPAWVVGSLVVPFGFTIVQVLVYLGVGVGLFGADFDIRGTLLGAPFLLLGIVSFGALAVMSGAFILMTKRGDPITTLFAQAVTYFAGGIFPTSLLPGPLEAVTRAVPAYWALEGLRRALLADAGWADVRGELLMLLLLTAILVPIALATFRWSVRVGRRTATLATY